MGRQDTARATAGAVSGLASYFMLDGATYATGGEHGFGGIDFYFAGRGGVLGDVPADVVAGTMVFFNPDTVRAGWEASAGVMSRADASALFMACGTTWAAEHLDDGVDWTRLAELATRIAEGASVAGAPLFAAWRRVAPPDDARARALFAMNLLRELRMARHGGAVIAVGLDPAAAVRHRSPSLVPVFGWPDGEDTPELVAQWDEAEALTDRATARDYAVLGDAEADEFAALSAEALASVH